MSTVVAHKKRSIPRTERRHSPRSVAYARIRVLVTLLDADGKPGESVEGVVTDLNRAGLGLTSESQLPAGARVVVELSLGTNCDTANLFANVIWRNPMPSMGHIIKSKDKVESKNTDAPNQSSRMADTRFWRIGMQFPSDDEEQGEVVGAIIKRICR